ncbi:MAG: site-2 protease family protein [Bacilli bacterium]|nr:site-2 protease family protein [Bacilli bacterium]
MGHIVTLLIFLVILGLIVFIHELGHFILAKLNGVYVHEFSLGFGPKLFSFKRKNDETEYMIKLLPLGGYVMLAGEEYEDEDKNDKKEKKAKKVDKDEVIVPENQKLYNKRFYQKFLIMVAGVFNNFVLGLILLFIMGLVYGCDYSNNRLTSLQKDLPLYEAGARNGDKLLKINGHKIKNEDDIILWVAINGTDKPLKVEIEKKGTKEVVNYKINAKELEDGKYFGITVKSGVKKGFIPAVKYAFTKVASIFKQLVIIIISLFSGKLGIDSVSGPVGIYSVVDMAKQSMYMLLYLTAYLSINVGFMNLLPFPAFDGGRAFLLIVEKIIGKKVPLKVESIINGVGFVLLMILMVLITIKDIIKLF